MELESNYSKKLEVELRNCMIIWLIVLLSLCYCYAIGKRISKGIKRLLAVLPIIAVFLYLPLDLHSFHLNFLTFFSIAWLCNSKLFLFAFGKGPLSSDPSSMSLAVFLAVASLPIKLRQNPPPNGQNKQHPSPENPKNGFPIFEYAIKGSLLAMLIYINRNYRVYDFSENIVFSTALYLYLIFEMVLTLVSTVAGALLGLELEPTFNAPLLSTSLQNFWGRRWNLMASNILRLTVYDPAKKTFTDVIGRRWATSGAVVATFLVSGLVHELMIFNLVRLKPTGEVTCYFLLHGACVAAEIELKKRLKKKLRFPWLISVVSTMGFVAATTPWLLFASMARSKAFARVLYEYGMVVACFENAMLRFGFI